MQWIIYKGIGIIYVERHRELFNLFADSLLRKIVQNRLIIPCLRMIRCCISNKFVPMRSGGLDNYMKLNYKRTFFIGLAFLSISSFWQMYDSIIPLILHNTFHLNETWTGVIMAADNILAVFLLPIIGSLSDRVDTRLGKRTPFVIGGTTIAVCCMMVLSVANNTRNFVLFVIILALTLIAMAMYRSPAVALMPDLTPKPLRSKANAIINLMGAIGGMYALVLIKTLVGKSQNPNYTPLFAGIAFMMIVAVVVLVITTREKKISEQIAKEYPQEAAEEVKKAGQPLPKEVKKSLVFILLSIFLWFTAYNAVTTAFSRYATVVWGIKGGGFADCLMVATVAAILSYIPIGILSSRFGRKRMIQGGIVLMFVSYTAAAMVTEFTPLINLGFALIGIGWASISVNSLPMVVEMCTGSDVGKFTGLYYTFSMIAQIITPILSGWLLQYVSYKTLFPYAMVFSVLAFITMCFVKHGDNRPTRKASLVENFDIDD